MQTLQPLKPGILRQPQRQPILHPELLQLGHHTVRQVRDALPQQTVHGVFEDVEFVLDGEVYEVGVD